MLDAAVLRQWGSACVAGLTARCDEINNLNVFPVADSDTGINLLLTMRAAVESSARVGGKASGSEVARAMARGALLGARGNSGIILSQVMRAVAETPGWPLSAHGLAAALGRGAALAREAMSTPVEGTIITILATVSDEILQLPEDMPLADAARHAATVAGQALDRTPEQLDVLGEAGVVDSGGRGLVVIIDALVFATSGSWPERKKYKGADDNSCMHTADATYEVMFVVTGPSEDAVVDLRRDLDLLGDSVAIVADGDIFSVHVHCADAGAAVEAGLRAGTLSSVRINYLGVSATAEASTRGVLALTLGEGTAALFEGAGASVVRAAHPVTPESIVSAVRALPHREVLLLANGVLNADELAVVGASTRDSHREVLLLPSLSMVQGLASVAVQDSRRVIADDVYAMSEAAASTRWGTLRIARDRALTLAGTYRPGNALGYVGTEVVIIDADLTAGAIRLVNKIVGLGGELLTILIGDDGDSELIDTVTSYVARNYHGVEVEVYEGGQPAEVFQIGFE